MAVALAGCEPAPSPSTAQARGMPAEVVEEDVRQQLSGAWLREYEEAGVQARRLLTLDADGAFRETVRVVDKDGGVTLHQHEGTWRYDGTNLKRHYRLMDGRPPSRLNLPFATFAVRFESHNSFVGVDHVHKIEVRYRRVQPETLL